MACAVWACSGEDNNTADSGTQMTADAGSKADGGTQNPDAGQQASTLYDRLGKEAGIGTVMDDFIVRVVGDAKINGYFLNNSVQGSRLKTCLVKQVGALTGGPQKYPGPGEAADADGCRDMKTAHLGMGVSMNDYGDLAGHLVAALQQAGVAAEDVMAITDALTAPAFVADIVEDAQNNKNIYQRIGRKPAVETVIADFLQRVLADAKINGYFLNSSLGAQRLGTCLVRQVCGATGGPCIYGEGVEAELSGTPCKDMLTAHKDMGVSTNDFNDLVGHMADALTAAQVDSADIMAIASVLTSDQMKMAVIEDANNNATVYQRVGRKPAIGALIGNFAPRVLGDATINGFFNTSTEAVARLGTCLVRQVCSVEGPCIYGEGVEPELMGTACRDMMSSHANLTNGAGGSPITINDFNALVTHLVDAMNELQIPAADQMVYINALAPMCSDIVANSGDCP